MEGVCRFSRFAGNYGPCEGPLLRYNDNPGDTIDCERHARLVTAWVGVTRGRNKPLHEFWDNLDEAAMREFEQKMKTADLRSYIPFVPKMTRCSNQRESKLRTKGRSK